MEKLDSLSQVKCESSNNCKDWKCLVIESEVMESVDKIINLDDELSFLNNKSLFNIPILYKYDELDKNSQNGITILKNHIFKSHKIITDIFELQILNEELIMTADGHTEKSDNINDVRIDGIISHILNSLHIKNIIEVNQ